jgi:high-affinity iron transporter
MFANYLIGLREGLEAALIVSILVAYLVRTDRRDLLRFVWAGVGIAVGLSLLAGAALTFGTRSFDDRAAEAFGGVMSLVAVALVTWMVFWMATRARSMKGELHAQMDRAIGIGGWALAVVAFVAVAREGLETALFLWSTIESTGGGAGSLLGAALGLATAVALGWAIYRGALRINLGTFFTWTGAALVVVAAGVLAYGVYELQEAGLLPGEDTLAFDLSAQIPPDSWYATLVRGVLNLRPSMTALAVAAWFAYLVPVMTLFLVRARGGRPQAKQVAATAVVD